MADAGLEPEVQTAFDDAARLLEELGHEVEDVPPGLLGADVLAAFEQVWSLSGTLLPVPPERVGELRPLTRELRARGLALSARAAMEALTALRLFARRFTTATAGYDVLLAPVTTMTPRPLGWSDADGDGAADLERKRGSAAFPAVSSVGVPRGVSVRLSGPPGGRRVGTMLAGRRADGAALAARAAGREAARPWRHRHPPS